MYTILEVFNNINYISECNVPIPTVISDNRSASVGEQVTFQCTVEFSCKSSIDRWIYFSGVSWKRNGTNINQADENRKYIINIR